MKDNYFSPEANLMEYNYMNVVSASHGLNPDPTPNVKNHCDIPTTKNSHKCGVTPSLKNKIKGCL